MIYVCTVCGYQYNEDAEMKSFAKLPADWSCPVCNAPKSSFQELEVNYNDSDG